ncbi:MAG: ABC-2 transporter permease [Candidatus Aminicenantes bacterium]|nr:ABC-2 transporter permease [Candidatus Aminicenantes bacterium]
MIKLIRKDLILHKKFVLGVGILYPLYLGFMGSRVDNLAMLPVLGGFLYAIVPLILFGREDKFKSEAFGLSLPVTRREYLRARFLLSWGLMFLMYAMGSLLMVAVPGARLAAATVFSPKMILLSLAFMAVYFGFLMPLFIRFGQVGMLVFIVALQLIGVLLMVFRSAVGVTTVKKLFRLIPDGVAAVQSSLGAVPAFLALLALLALLTYASFELSAAFLRRKEF